MKSNIVKFWICTVSFIMSLGILIYTCHFNDVAIAISLIILNLLLHSKLSEDERKKDVIIYLNDKVFYKLLKESIILLKSKNNKELHNAITNLKDSRKILKRLYPSKENFDNFCQCNCYRYVIPCFKYIIHKKGTLNDKENAKLIKIIDNVVKLLDDELNSLIDYDDNLADIVFNIIEKDINDKNSKIKYCIKENRRMGEKVIIND